ncbi:hypothetical protein ACXWTF_13110 [Thiomicrolovo sp. ZZH C-3]
MDAIIILWFASLALNTPASVPVNSNAFLIQLNRPLFATGLSWRCALFSSVITIPCFLSVRDKRRCRFCQEIRRAPSFMPSD